jgi:dynein heavy chain
VRLWTHEVLRVFCDRLVGPEDRAWAAGQLVHLTETHFRERLPRLLGLTEPPAGSPPLPADQVVEGLRGLLFGNFMVPGAGG